MLLSFSKPAYIPQFILALRMETLLLKSYCTVLLGYVGRVNASGTTANFALDSKSQGYCGRLIFILYFILHITFGVLCCYRYSRYFEDYRAILRL